MKRRIMIILIVLFAVTVNGEIFDKVFSTSKKPSLIQAEPTLFTFHAIQSRYLNKEKLNPAALLDEALNAIQERYSEIVASYDPAASRVNLQIYNQNYTVEVKRLKDLWDVAIVLRQIYGVIEKHYVPKDDEEITDVEYVALNGILRKLDPHSYIFTPKEFTDFTSTTEGNFGGLGIVISINDDGEIMVVSPIDGTPAEKAGIESGDVIVQIDDESAINLPLQKAVEKMRGEPGTDIMLYIKRKDVPSVLKVPLTRALIKIKSVIYAMPAKEIGYIKLTGFMENTYDQFILAVESLKKKGMKALILDMRNNAGGLLDQAIKISDLLLDKGVIVSTVSSDEKEVTEAAKAENDLLDIPMVVLINEGAASASEIVAAALKKNQRAILVGRKSFGKGSVQNLFRVPGGGGLKLTIAQYLTPGDISIQSQGVIPNIELIPSYIDKKKTSLFKNGMRFPTEKDLKEHIESRFIPETPDKPELVINYYRPYKDIETLIKEGRKEKVGVFKDDEEIRIATDLLEREIKTKEGYLAAAQKIREAQWGIIRDRLKKEGIIWKDMPGKEKIDPAKLKVTLVKGEKLEAGKENELVFKATYPGEVNNLDGVLVTSIPYLKDTEIVFGSFNGSVERKVPIKLPESMPWRKEPVILEIGTDGFDKIVKKEAVTLETLPLPTPDIEMTYLLDEKKGKYNGIAQDNEDVVVRVWMKNKGEGKIEDARLLLLNPSNSKEVFIKKGSEPIALAPGEVKQVNFEFSLRQPDKKNLMLAVSLYDYTTKYSAGFSIPVNIPVSDCVYSGKQKPENGMLAAGIKLYPDVISDKPVALVDTEGRVTVLGSCGNRLKLSDGFWIIDKEFKDSSQIKKPAGIKELFTIAMPVITVDTSPSMVEKPEEKIVFSVSGAKLQDVFVYLNNRKVFYKRVSDSDQPQTFTVPLQFKYKTNKISVLVKGTDPERTAVEEKYLIYTKGIDEGDVEE